MTDSLHWLEHALEWYANALRIHNVKINVGFERVINCNEHTVGSCSFDYPYNVAYFTFRDDITNDYEGHNTIVHELCHVKHGAIDRAFELALDTVHESVANTHIRMYEELVYEPYNTDMADILTALLYGEWEKAYATVNPDRISSDANSSEPDTTDNSDDQTQASHKRRRRRSSNNRNDRSNNVVRFCEATRPNTARGRSTTRFI